MRLMVSLGKIGIGVSLIASALVSISSYAGPEIDHMTICYGVNSKDKMSFKKPCIVTNTGGSGTIVTIYQIDNKEYTIVHEDGGDWLNDKPYKGYLRDAFFRRTKDTDDYSYYCYQSKIAHFCSKQ